MAAKMAAGTRCAPISPYHANPLTDLSDLGVFIYVFKVAQFNENGYGTIRQTLMAIIVEIYAKIR